MKVNPSERLFLMKERIAQTLKITPSALVLLIQEKKRQFQPLKEQKLLRDYFPKFSPTQSLFIFNNQADVE
jgi:hypothetical protein